MSSSFLTRSDTKQAIWPQKMATGLNFWIKKVEGLYYLCSKHKGTEQLCGGYQAADLWLCFCKCKKQVFS